MYGNLLWQVLFLLMYMNVSSTEGKKRTCQRPKHSLEEICNFLKNQTTQCNIQVLLSSFLIYFDFFYFGISPKDPSFLNEDFPPGVNNEQKDICPVVSGINTLEHTQLRHSFIVLVFLSGMFFWSISHIPPPTLPTPAPFSTVNTV